MSKYDKQLARKMKQKQLRKQPKRRRAYSSTGANFQRLNVPPTAKKRRRRQKTEGVRFGLVAMKRIIFSSRWISLGLLALTLFALVIIVQERRFYLTYVPVEGAVSFTTDEIVAASELAGQHVFSADPSQAAAKITALPGVISSTVSLKWPNQVYIEITEEAPVAVWQEHGLAYGITSSGRLIPVGFPLTGLLQIIPETGPNSKAAAARLKEETAAVEPTDPAVEVTAVDDTAVVEDPGIVDDAAAIEDTAAVEDADTVEGNLKDPEKSVDDTGVDVEKAKARGSTDGALEPSIAFVPQEVLLGALNLREMRPAINELYYRPSEGLSYQDGRGWRVHFGTGTDMNQKLVLYETILNDLLTRGISPAYISVSNKEKPFYLAQ